MKERNSEQRLHDPDNRTTYPQSRGNLWLGMIIGGLAVLVLVLAYQLFSRQTVNNNSQSLSPATTAPNTAPVPSSTSQAPNPASTQAQATAPVSNSNAQTAVASSGVQPNQFMQPALNNKAQVELLKVNRIPGQRDVVNVQVRIRAIRPEKAVGSDAIYMGGATARNPETSETYESVSSKSTGSVSLFTMRLEKQSSADAYVWLRVPEGVNTIDIYLPNTQAFKNVSIAS